MLFVVEGAVSASLDVPGDRTVDIGTVGPGEAVGELGVLDGGGHTMNVRVTEPATVLALGRPDFAALVTGRHRSALTLRRRLASLSAARLRNQIRHLAISLGGETAGLISRRSSPGAIGRR